MRAREFVTEGDVSPSVANLINLLDNLRSRTDQVRVDSLVNLIRKEPGSEMFNIDLLKDAFKEGQLDNVVENIKKDESDVLYVYLKPLVSDREVDITNFDSDTSGPKTPERTVSSMAKRAAAKRLQSLALNH